MSRLLVSVISLFLSLFLPSREILAKMWQVSRTRVLGSTWSVSWRCSSVCILV